MAPEPASRPHRPASAREGAAGQPPAREAGPANHRPQRAARGWFSPRAASRSRGSIARRLTNRASARFGGRRAPSPLRAWPPWMGRAGVRPSAERPAGWGRKNPLKAARGPSAKRPARDPGADCTAAATYQPPGIARPRCGGRRAPSSPRARPHWAHSGARGRFLSPVICWAITGPGPSAWRGRQWERGQNRRGSGGAGVWRPLGGGAERQPGGPSEGFA